MQTDYENRLLRIEQVLEIVPLSRSAWYAGIKQGRYPAPVKLGARASAWRASDIKRLIEQASTEGL